MEAFEAMFAFSMLIVRTPQAKLGLCYRGICSRGAFLGFPQSSGFAKITSFIDNDIDLFDCDVTLDMNLKHPELILY